MVCGGFEWVWVGVIGDLIAIIAHNNCWSDWAYMLQQSLITDCSAGIQQKNIEMIAQGMGP